MGRRRLALTPAVAGRPPGCGLGCLGLLLPALGLLLLSCDPKPGDACEKGNALCLDSRTALVCQNGKAIASPCKGPSGCKVESSLMLCDISGNAEGDVCSTDHEGEAGCSTDGKSKVTCQNGKYVHEPCRGPEGCQLQGDTAICDVSISAEGDSCKSLASGASACDPGGKTLLECKGAKFVAVRSCLGPVGCKVTPEGVACDFRISKAGQAACPEGFKACSEDRKHLLLCQGGKLVADTKCDGPKGCTVEEDPKKPLTRLMDPSTVRCDTNEP